MRLLQLTNDGELSLTKNRINNIPPYAILSHTWGDDEEEVTFKDLSEGSGKPKTGYRKIQFCGAQAAHDGLQHFWVDTCCIDKTNNAELSEAINSMFNWYQDADICYVYLSDALDFSTLDSSRWFRRGWTLQELLAPKRMVFFNSRWVRLDTRSNLSPTISRITGIPRRMLLLDFSGEYSVAQVMSWAAGRETTREEDIAYCLLGLLGVNMPLLYGEGPRAFERLQQEFMKTSTDHSLFSWRGPGAERGPFARSPTEFRHCKDFTAGEGHSLDFSMTNRGLRIDLPLVIVEDGNFAAVLDCRGPDNFRRAIYLKEVRPKVYRRVRCTEELRRIDPGEVISTPTTVYIEPAIPRTLGRDRSMPRKDGYSFRVDFRAALLNSFSLEQHYSPDDKFQWNLTNSTEGFSFLTVDCSGQYGGLRFNNTESGEEFSVILGIHNWKAWLDITNIGTNETFESVVEEYYHYRTAHVKHNIYISINSGEFERQFRVEITVNIDG
ncbi:hypothetical protein LTR46_004279 [Exophiala xenobiotica]|nr:hypothetical protein LTR46_004279 [Exophiala xenobiotica]